MRSLAPAGPHESWQTSTHRRRTGGSKLRRMRSAKVITPGSACGRTRLRGDHSGIAAVRGSNDLSHSDSVLVVGAINTDLVVRVNRAPDAGETITGSRFDIFGGGKGANQALACARSG